MRNHRARATGTIYPRLPDIPDEQTLSRITDLDDNELNYASTIRSERNRYLVMLHVKAMEFLNHSRFEPGDIPRLMRIRLALALNLPRDLVSIQKIAPSEKSRAVSRARAFLNIRPDEEQTRKDALRFLKQHAAKREGDPVALANKAVEWFRQNKIELPPFQALGQIAETALKTADREMQRSLGRSLSKKAAESLDALLVKDSGQTALDMLKDPFRHASPINLMLELTRLNQLELSLGGRTEIDIPRRKIEAYADLVSRYHASELKQISPGRRRAVLLCYLVIRRAELLDGIVEMFIHNWRMVRSHARTHANEYRERKAALQERQEKVLKGLLEIICDACSDEDLVKALRRFMPPEEYLRLREELRDSMSWNECLFKKIHDHYSALRQFLPLWYEKVPLESTTSDESILKPFVFSARTRMWQAAICQPMGFQTAS